MFGATKEFSLHHDKGIISKNRKTQVKAHKNKPNKIGFSELDIGGDTNNGVISLDLDFGEGEDVPRAGIGEGGIQVGQRVVPSPIPLDGDGEEAAVDVGVLEELLDGGGVLSQDPVLDQARLLYTVREDRGTYRRAAASAGQCNSRGTRSRGTRGGSGTLQ